MLSLIVVTVKFVLPLCRDRAVVHEHVGENATGVHANMDAVGEHHEGVYDAACKHGRANRLDPHVGNGNVSEDVRAGVWGGESCVYDKPRHKRSRNLDVGVAPGNVLANELG